jgi:osmoprotectant transport system substrate-binding protein
VRVPPIHRAPIAGLLAVALAAVSISGCAGSGMARSKSATDGPVTTTTTTTAGPLPGTGKPQVIIGDKNYTEQFVLGELYAEALTAQGYSVEELNSNIGPTSVTLAALKDGQLDMYPEYLGYWDYDIAHHHGGFHTVSQAFLAAQQYAGGHGLTLLDPTPFSNTPGIAVTLAYAQQNHLHSIGDLRRVGSKLMFGGPPQFEQSNPGLPSLEQTYGFTPAGYTPLDIGAQYADLDDASIQAADVNTTDGQLASGDYTLLRDPRNVFGWGQAVPVVSTKVLDEMGPDFAATINKVDALLTLANIRWLNSEVDIAHRDPAVVARQFLLTHGVILPGSPS